MHGNRPPAAPAARGENEKVGVESEQLIRALNRRTRKSQRVEVIGGGWRELGGGGGGEEAIL